MIPPPELNTRTDAAVQTFPEIGMDGRIYLSVVIKQRFYIDTAMQVAPIPGAEIQVSDIPWDDAVPDSIQYPSDMCLRKPSTDVIVAGSAHVAGDTPATQVDVMLRLGTIEKFIRVFGPRVWYQGVTGLTMTAPEPFYSCQIRWDYAWGGMDVGDGKLAMEGRNPVGCGMTNDSDTLIHEPAPRIEDPMDLIDSHRSRPRPAGLGAIGRSWEPRSAYSGTCDEEWMQTRMPIMPLDFDERYHQCAPADQVAPEYLQGGERVQIQGMCFGQPLEFELPRQHYFVGTRIDGVLQEFRPHMDTVILMPDERAFDMVWRSAIPMPRPSRRIGSIQVYDRQVI